MKVCFIGSCGHWRHPLHNLKSEKDIVFCGFAPASPHENKTDSINEVLPFFENYRDMLDITKPDLAIVAPVFGITGQVIIECANRKIDVFSEKPIATSFEELNEVERAVKQNGIRFCAMHYLRFNPAFYNAAGLVREGKIGAVQMITAQKSYQYGTRPYWYSDPDLYGGTIPWVGIHAIDWVSLFSGKRFISVTAQSTGGCPEMAALCQFKLEDNVIASVNLDYYRPETAGSHGDDRVRCVGTAGIIEVIKSKITLINSDGVNEYCPDTAPELFTEFFNGNDPIPVDEIFHMTKAAIAAKQSAITGKTIVIGDN